METNNKIALIEERQEMTASKAAQTSLGEINDERLKRLIIVENDVAYLKN
jgi:hypothetical protein